MTWTAARCYVCNQSEADSPEVELRPYGINGQPICFECMTADPEREREAGKQFEARLAGIGPVAVIDGSSGGVRGATYAEALIVSDLIDDGALPGLPVGKRPPTGDPS